MNYPTEPMICVSSFNLFDRTTATCVNTADIAGVGLLIIVIYGAHAIALDLYRLCKRQ